MPPAGSIDAAENVARLLGHVDDDPPAAILFWNVIPEYRVLIADGLLDVPLFDVSPGVMSFDALDRYFERPRPGLPYRNAADYGARLSAAIVKYQAEAARAAVTLQCPVHVIPNGVPIDTTPRRPAGGPVGDRHIGTDQPAKAARSAARCHPACPSVALPPYVLRVAGGVERGCDDHAAELAPAGRGAARRVARRPG